LEETMPICSATLASTHELPGTRFTELINPRVGARDTCVSRVEIAPGTPATPHEVTREEVFVILSGRARVTIDGVDGEAKAGDAVLVPANTLFAISNAGDQPLAAICCLPVGGQARLPGQDAFTPPWAQ
jgi:mannose-6-phosphate isomerase-like protein (cupin superfamily)